MIAVFDDNDVNVENIAAPLPEDGIAASGLVNTYDACASVRYRAVFRDGELALGDVDSQDGVRVRSIMMGRVWQGVDRTVDELQLRTAAAVNPYAIKYPYNSHKGDRQQKTKIRSEYAMWGAFQPLTKHIGFKD